MSRVAKRNKNKQDIAPREATLQYVSCTISRQTRYMGRVAASSQD